MKLLKRGAPDKHFAHPKYVVAPTVGRATVAAEEPSGTNTTLLFMFMVQLPYGLRRQSTRNGMIMCDRIQT